MLNTITTQDVFTKITKRNPESHKGTYGKALLIAGSTNFRGAASLASEGALRVGTGIVTLASTEPVINAVSARLPECCFLPCSQNTKGGISSENTKTICSALAKSSALLIGCGLQNTADTASLVHAVLQYSAIPIVLDADALNAIAKMAVFPTNGQKCEIILTPHLGEMSSLTGLTVAEINANRLEISLCYAKKHNCTLVLKGHETIIACADGSAYKNTTGNAGLARGGSGDILAGMITGFLAQGFSTKDACIVAVHLHGLAADICAKTHGQYTMLPHDIFNSLCGIFAENEL